MGLAGFLTAFAAFYAAITTNTTTKPNLRAGSSVTNCNTASLFHFDSGQLNPPNPPPNTNTTPALQFTNSYQVISDGTVDYQVNLNGLPYAYSEPLCSPNMAALLSSDSILFIQIP